MVMQVRALGQDKNRKFTSLAREASETNTQWGARAVAEMSSGGPDQWTYIALLGGSDSMAFRLRVAQSHLRRDMLPSFWSEAVLVALEGESLDGARAIHVPLMQPEGPEFATRTNGVVERPLTDFDDPRRYPNIALIALPIPQADLLARVEAFKRSRSTLDALEHILRWLAFAWGAARTPNPLHDNYGLPSACMLETICAAEKLDLTPGLESRASCPEAIWVAARYWQNYYKQFLGSEPVGRYWAPHLYPIEEPVEAESSTGLPAAFRAAEARGAKKAAPGKPVPPKPAVKPKAAKPAVKSAAKAAKAAPKKGR